MEHGKNGGLVRSKSFHNFVSHEDVAEESDLNHLKKFRELNFFLRGWVVHTLNLNGEKMKIIEKKLKI